MSSEQNVDVIVIGSGQAGVPLATRLAAAGKRVIHVFSVLMQSGASVRSIVDGEFVHPTYGEGLQSAVMTLPRYSLNS